MILIAVTRVHLHRPTDRPLAAFVASMEKQKDLSKSMDNGSDGGGGGGGANRENKQIVSLFLLLLLGGARERNVFNQNTHQKFTYFYFSNCGVRRRIENLSYCLLEWK